MKNINNNLISLFAIISIIALNIAFISPKEANAYTTKGSYTTCGGTCEDYNNNYSNNNTNNGYPVIYSTNPTKISSNAGLKSITIVGTGFRPDSIARWNVLDKPTSFINSEKLIMELDNEDTFQDGKYIITVVNPSPEGGRFSNPKTIIVSSYLKEGVKTVANPTNTKSAYVNTGSYKAKGTTTMNTNTTTEVKKTENKTEVKGATDEKKEENTACVTSTTNNDDNNSSLLANTSKGNSSFLPDTIAEWLILIILIVLGVVLLRRIWTTKTEKNKPLKHA